MAGNWGKFIDRTPTICTAGKPCGDPNETVPSCLKDYRLDSQVTALLHDAGVFEERKTPFQYKQPKLQNLRHCGIHTQSYPALRPPIQTRYQTLINDLKETSYDSYWNKLEGKTRDPLPGLPAGMDVIQTTFGSATKRSPSAYEVITPPKKVYQVLWDSQVGHEMYCKSHNDYNPGEQKNRNYSKPPFDPDRSLGISTFNDPRGVLVRCACCWHDNNPLTSVSSIHADNLERTRPRLGKVLTPNNNIDYVPKGHRFGKPCNRELYGMEELLKDANCEPCIFKRDFRQWITHLNQLRVYLKRRFNKFDFDFKTFRDRNMFFDKENTGWVPLELFYDICRCYDVRYEYKCLEPFFEFFGVIQDNNINYRDFIFLADINSSVPEMIKIDDVPKNNQYYISNAMAASCDFTSIDNSKMRPAGVPLIRYDRKYPVTPAGGCKADLESLGDETTAEAIVNPSIYSTFGTSYLDFFMPRPPEILRTVFENIGYEFPDDTFEKLWKIGLERDKTGLVCVETFKHILNESVPPPRLLREEDTC